MQITSASDINGDVISIGTQIKGWHAKEEYTATITGFEHYYANVVRVVATRDDDGTEIKAFSDSVFRVQK